MKALWTAITLLIMAIGLVGTVLPVIPGILLIYAGYLLYGFATGWQAYGLRAIVGWSVVTVLVLLLDVFAGAIGAKRYGATRFGTWGSLIGGLIGALAAGFPGLILGPFVGATAGELLRGRSHREALRSGWGTFLGFMAGSVIKIAIGVVMVGTFIWWVLV
ncbi:MAG: DUF456 domain-containing protein [Syntrophorhabdales bacterium]|jgi:uncharacterized protein YqgC (DUF456 family)